MVLYLKVYFHSRLQMFEAEEDGAITETELAIILKTALGVANLSVSHLFSAIDVEDTGKITYGNYSRITKLPWTIRIFLTPQPSFSIKSH